MSTRLGYSGSGTLAATLLMVLAPFALGYFLSYLFRAVNAVVGAGLVAEIGLSAAGLGLLTSAYLFAFALFQLPLGVLLDRFGPRRVQAALLGCAALGSLLFAIGRDIATLTCARALIGLGFAGGLMSGFKAVVLWVPEPRRALANGVRHVVRRARRPGRDGAGRARGPGSRLARGVRRARRDHLRGRGADPARRAGARRQRGRRGPGASDRRAAPDSAATARSGDWRPCWRLPPAPTSRSRRCGRGPGCATSPASIGSASPTT